MHILISIVLMFLMVFPITEMTLGEKNQTNSENYSISRENTSNTTESTKIHQTLVEWKNSNNPEEFASQFNIPHKDNKIIVYIYLENAKFTSDIPSEIEVISSSENIVRAFVTPNDLYELENLDFVKRITLPELAQTPPIPKVDVPQDQPKKQGNSNLWILIPILLIIAVIAVIIKTRKKTDS